MKGSLSLRGFRKLRTGAIVATGVFLIGLANVQTTVQASEEDGVWVARTVEQVKADIQKEDNFFKYEIKWGDTLSVISEATNIPVDVLKEMNRISDRNLFLPHNEFLYTEGEHVTDSKIKHKIVIKESYGKKEVRTYEVVLQENHETAEVSFELKETTEKVQASCTSIVSYGEVYNLVSDQAEGTVETPREEVSVTPGTTETPAPTKPAEGTPTAPGATETPAPTKPAEGTPAGSGATETPAPAQPAETTPAAPGATENPAPAQPVETTPAGSGATENPAPAQPAESTPAVPGTTENPAPAQPEETTPAGSGATETPAPAQPAETTPTAPGATETPTPTDSNNQSNPTEPKDDVEKGLEENNSELESRKNIKLEEIESSSLPSSEKEAAKLKVEEYTNKAKEAMKQAKTTDDQAAVVDNYSDDLATINTPGVDQGKPDYTNSGLSGNGPEGTHIGDNNAIGHGNSTPENTGFRNAPVYQPRVTRRARSVDEPMDKVAIYYNYTEMKDIAGFLGDPGESVVTVPKGATHEQVQAIVKSKIDEKKAELAKKGYSFLEDYFVDKPQEDTIRYDYIVNFTKPSSLRMAPMIQPRSSRTRRSVEEPKVKTRTITLYYQLAELEIAGSLGNPGQNYVITVPETATAEEIQQAIDQQTSREKASLSRYFQYVGETNLQNDILDRGFGNFDYVITFARRK